MSDLSTSLVGGVSKAFSHIGSRGKVALFLIIAFFVFPYLLRIISFFRRGGGTSV